MRRDENGPRHGWLRLYRSAWRSVAGLVGTAGVASLWLEVGTGGALLLLAALTLLSVFGIWQFGGQRGDGRPGRDAVVLGAFCALGILALLGSGYGLGPVGVAAGALVAVAGWPLRRRRSPAPPSDRTSSSPAPVAGPPAERLPDTPLPACPTLRDLSTPRLCWTWRVSYVCLRRYPWPSYRESLADLRKECLDELERRDPVAFARWFPTARAASDPARYFCAQSRP